MALENQILQAIDLKQDDFLLLFTLVTPNGYTARFCSKYPVTFLGVNYELLPNQIQGLQETISEEVGRPVWEIHNPNNIFNKIAVSGELEGAIVDLIRIRESQLNVIGVETILNRWKVYRLISVNTVVRLELRLISDFPQGKFPVRGYYPPDFRAVSF